MARTGLLKVRWGGGGGDPDHRMKITLVGPGKGGGMRDVVCNHFYADIQTAELFTGLIIILQYNTRMKNKWMEIFHFRNPPPPPKSLHLHCILFVLSRNLPEIFRPVFRCWSTVDFYFLTIVRWQKIYKGSERSTECYRTHPTLDGYSFLNNFKKTSPNIPLWTSMLKENGEKDP